MRNAILVTLLLLALAGVALVAGSGLMTPSPVPADRGVFVPAGTPQYRWGGYSATLLNDGRVLVVGGDQSPDSAEVWDPTTMAFTPTGSPNISRSGHTATLLPDGRVLIVGGGSVSDGDTSKVDLAAEIWNPETDTFVLSGRVASEALSATPPMVLADGRVLVGRGAAAEVFDPGTGTFVPAGSDW